MKAGSLALSFMFWIAGIALALWIVRCPPNQLIFSANLCGLIPLFALAGTKFSGGRIVISGQRLENTPDAFPLLLLPSLGLTIRALGPSHMMNWQIALAYSAIIAIVWSSLVYFVGTFSQRRGKAVTFVILYIAGLAYGYGSVCLIDTVADKATPKTTEVMVRSKYIGAGRGHTPYLVLGPSVVKPEGGDESVSQEVYERTLVNQTVCLVEHPGSLGLKWYEILLCESSLQA